MNLSPKKSSIHHHLTRPVFKKPSNLRAANAAEDKAAKVESGFGELQMGTETLSVPAAYKPIFRF